MPSINIKFFWDTAHGSIEYGSNSKLYYNKPQVPNVDYDYLNYDNVDNITYKIYQEVILQLTEEEIASIEEFCKNNATEDPTADDTVVRTTAQDLSTTKQATARGNISAPSVQEMDARFLDVDAKFSTVDNKFNTVDSALSTKLDKTGTAPYADKAWNDQDGNNIKATYARKEQVVSSFNGQQGDVVVPTPKAYITETWHSGVNWYRVWSDGFIEQGGIKINQSYNPPHTLNKAFSNKNYSVQGTWANDDRWGNPICLFARDRSTFTLYTQSGGPYTFNWYACGY